MKSVAILLAIEAVLFAGAYLAAGRQLRLAALYLIAVSAPLEVYRTTTGGVNPSLFRIAIAVAFLVAAYELLRDRAQLVGALKRIAGDRLVQAYLLLAALIGLSLVVNPVNTFLGNRLLATVGIGTVTIALVLHLGRGVPPARIVAAFAFGCVLPVLAGAWQAFAVNRGWDPALPLLDQLPLAEGLEKSRDVAGYLGDTTRERGPFADANHFGALLVLGLVAAFALALRESVARNLPRAVAFGALGVACGSTLLATYSRSAWLGATVAVVLLAALAIPLLRGRIPRRTAVIGGVTLVLVGTAAIVPLAPELSNRLDSSRTENEISNESHDETVEAAWDIFTDDPVLGAGVGAIGEELDQGERTSGAHSSYLTVAAELGALGLLVLLAAAGIVLGRLWRRYRRADAAEDRLLYAGLAAAYVGFMVSAALYDLWFDDFHWALLALVAAITASDRAVGGHDAVEHPVGREVEGAFGGTRGVAVPESTVSAQLADR